MLFMVEGKADLKAKDDGGWTALHHTVECGQLRGIDGLSCFCLHGGLGGDIGRMERDGLISSAYSRHPAARPRLCHISHEPPRTNLSQMWLTVAP